MFSFSGIREFFRNFDRTLVSVASVHFSHTRLRFHRVFWRCAVSVSQFVRLRSPPALKRPRRSSPQTKGSAGASCAGQRRVVRENDPQPASAHRPSTFLVATVARRRGSLLQRISTCRTRRQAVGCSPVNVRRVRRLRDAGPQSVRLPGSAGGDRACWSGTAESRTGTR